MTNFSGSIAMNYSLKMSNWTSPASGFDAAAQIAFNKPTAWNPCVSKDDWEVPHKHCPFITPDDSVHRMIPANSRAAAHFADNDLSGPFPDDLTWLISTDAPREHEEDTTYHHCSPVFDNHMLDSTGDAVNEMQRQLREQDYIVEDICYHLPLPSFHTDNAMDFDSTMRNGFPQYTLASPIVSADFSMELPRACLPVTSPVLSAPLQLEVPQIKNATDARAADARGRPGARRAAVAERSASRGRSRSRSPIRSAEVAIADVSGDESGSSKVLLRATSDEGQSAKKPAQENAHQTRNKKGAAVKEYVHQTKSKTTAGKKKGSGGKMGGGRKKEKTSKYLGVSFHRHNLKWRTTVYNGSPRHMGYFVSEEDAARRYDEVSVAVWNEHTQLNFPITDYPAKEVLDKRWKPVLEAKAQAQLNKQKATKKPARLKLLQEEAEAELQATGGIISKTPAQMPQKRRRKKSTSYPDSDVTTTLESLLEDGDEDADEEEVNSRRSPPSVATRTPRPMRKAALQAQENLKAMMDDLAECEKDSDEAPSAPAGASCHARATAAAERRLRASQGRPQPRDKMPGVESSAVLQPAMFPLPLPAFGLPMEKIDEVGIEDQLLTDLTSDLFAQSTLLAS